jgi:hypothetical protein
MIEYRISDARKPLEEKASVACVDLAWARPQRNGVYTTYPTYSPDNGLWEFVDAVYHSLEEGGWAFFDADDWLLPRITRYIQETWGDVASTYSGGGYRRTGTVVYEGHSGGGHYFTNGGYHVVFAHKDSTDRKSSVSSKIVTERVPRKIRSNVDWGTLKPIKPYRCWIESVTEPRELIYVPCAGSAPAMIVSEEIERDCIAIDSEAEAKKAYETRRSMQISRQSDNMFKY